MPEENFGPAGNVAVFHQPKHPAGRSSRVDRIKQDTFLAGKALDGLPLKRRDHGVAAAQESVFDLHLIRFK